MCRIFFVLFSYNFFVFINFVLIFLLADIWHLFMDFLSNEIFAFSFFMTHTRMS